MRTTPMKIECTIRRELEAKQGDRVVKIGPGTKIPMGDKVYTFKPETEDGPHLAEVIDADHIARFKSIRESFQPGPGAKWPKGLPESSIGREPEVEVEKDDDGFGEHVADGGDAS